MFIPWPLGYGNFLGITEFALLGADQLQMNCHISDAGSKYIVRVMASSITIAMVGMFYCFSKFTEMNWKVEAILCPIGVLSQFGFSTMASIAVDPFVCYTHPVGSQSVVSYPEVICGSTGTYQVLFTFSIIMFLVVFGVMAFILFLVYPGPRITAGGFDVNVAGKFLFLRYRVDVFYWEAVVMTRSLLLSLAAIVSPDQPVNQMAISIVVLVGSAILTAESKPFRVPLFNVSEIAMCFSLSMIMAVSGAYTAVETDDARYYQSMLFLITVSAGIPSAFFVFRAAFVTVQGRISLEDDRICSLGYAVVDVISFAGRFKKACSDVNHILDNATIEKYLQDMPVYDVRTLNKAISTLGRSKLFQERIARGSAEFAEKEPLSVEVRVPDPVAEPRVEEV